MRSNFKKAPFIFLIGLTLAIIGVFFTKNDPNYLKGNLNFVPCSTPSIGTGPYTTFVDGTANVMAPYHDLQSAIDGSKDGDVIVVCPGTYEGFTIDDRELALRGLGAQINDVQITSQNTNGIAKIKQGSVVDISNMSFKNGENRNIIGGGALTVTGSKVKILHANFSGNRSYAGGAILAAYSTQLTIDDCKFQNNQAAWEGGAIAGSGNIESPLEMTVINSQFTENEVHTKDTTVGTGGGAIALSGDEDADVLIRKDSLYLNIDTSTFEQNTSNSYGGAVTASLGYIKIVDSIFKENVAALNGGAFFGQALEMRLEDTQLGRNVSGESGGAVAIVSNDPAPIRIFNSHFEDNDARNGAYSAGSAIFATNGRLPVSNEFKFKNSLILHNSGQNCDGVAGHSQDLGQNQIDDNSCF